MASLLDLLAENLDPQLGPAGEIADAIGEDAALFDEIFAGLFCDEPLLQSRAVNVIERVSRKHPVLLQRHKAEVWRLFQSGYQGLSMKINMPMLLGYLDWEEEELGLVLDTLEDALHKEVNKFVKVACLQALADQADKHPWLKQEMIVLIRGQMEEGSASMKARCRKLLKKWE